MDGIKPEPNLKALDEADPQRLYVEILSAYDYMMRVEDVAEFLGQTKQAVTHYLREGRLIGTKCGSSWRIPKKTLIEYLYRQSNDAQ